MASCKAPWWRLFLTRRAPWLFSVCAGGNFHWFWQTHCICCVDEHFGDHRGGVMIRKWVDEEVKRG